MSQHCTSLRSVGVVAAVASSKSEVCNPVYIITGDGDEEITSVSMHNSNSLFKPPRCFYTHLQVLDAMHIFSMHFKSSSDAILILLNSSLIHFRCIMWILSMQSLHLKFQFHAFQSHAPQTPVPCISSMHIEFQFHAFQCSSMHLIFQFHAFQCKSSVHLIFQFHAFQCSSMHLIFQFHAFQCKSSVHLIFQFHAFQWKSSCISYSSSMHFSAYLPCISVQIFRAPHIPVPCISVEIFMHLIFQFHAFQCISSLYVKF